MFVLVFNPPAKMQASWLASFVPEPKERKHAHSEGIHTPPTKADDINFGINVFLFYFCHNIEKIHISI